MKRCRSYHHPHDDNRRKQYPSKRNRHSPSSSSATSNQTHSQSPPPIPKKLPKFSTYLDTPNLPSKIKLLSEIIATTPSTSIEQLLHDSNLRVTQSDVEQVLKLSYPFPACSVKFFRWAGSQFDDKHSPYAWNLVVDLLGKNCLFDAMWDAIKSMRHSGLVSLATFASVFASYVIAGRVKEAIVTFEVMNQYNCARDIVALNSLLSAICRDGNTVDASEFLRIVKQAIKPDCDSYAILLEGWEKEMNVVSAQETFAEMVLEIGWNPNNVPAYDAFLCTLLMGRDGLNGALKFFNSMKERGCYPGMKFLRLSLNECLKCRDARTAGLLWEAMVVKIGFRPNAELYKLMITLHCYANKTEVGKKFFDELVYNGVVPDVQTYNVLFQFLVKSRMLTDASVLFGEMVKNNCIPSQMNCSAAIRVYINSMEGKDPYMALKVWKIMVDNYESDLEESGNLLVVGLCELHKLPEAVKCAEGMIEKGIRLTSSSLSKLRKNLSKARKYKVYEKLRRKLKAN